MAYFYLGVNRIMPLTFFIFSCVYLFCDFLDYSWFGWLIIGLVDLYLLMLLAMIALEKHKPLPELPIALMTVPALLLILVMAFGQLYITSGKIKRMPLEPNSQVEKVEPMDKEKPSASIVAEPLKEPWDAVYFSLVTITTLGYGDYTPQNTDARKIVVGELLSGVLLLLFAIPLLISRLAAMFDKPTGTTTVIGVRRLEDGSWTVQENDGAAVAHQRSQGLTITVKAQGKITNVVERD